MGSPVHTGSLSSDLNSFIYGISRRNFQNAPELTKVGITLLKNFPAARDAVLEYFAMVFREAVNVSINQPDYESESNINPSLDSVSMIGPELCSMGAAWAPFIAPWCTKLLMDIATDKANLPNSTLQNSEPVRILLDITTQNLTLLNAEERAKCIDMMLGCRACSWAVGWVGRAEPALVAPRALALGADAAKAVLAHLANHPPALLHVRAALLDLFNEAISEDSSRAEKNRDVIPYLLNLASKSDIALKALIQDIDKTLTDKVLDRVISIYNQYRNTSAWEAIGPGSLVTLLVRADVKCLNLLLQRATNYKPCARLIEYLLQKLEFDSLSSERRIPLLDNALDYAHIVRDSLLDGKNKLEQYTMARILILVCSRNQTEFVNTISYMLQFSRDDATLALLVRIIAGTITNHLPNDSPDVVINSDKYQNNIRMGVENALNDSMISDTQIKGCFVTGKVNDEQKTYLHHVCLNLKKLLKWESSNRVTVLRNLSIKPITRAVEDNVHKIGQALAEYSSLLRIRPPGTMASLPEMPTCHALAEVLEMVDYSGKERPQVSVEAAIVIVKAIVRYFFRSIHEKDLMTKILSVQTACSVLRKLCLNNKMCRNLALRQLLEVAMFRENGKFGGKDAPNDLGDWDREELLLHLNQKHGLITQLTQSHTSVFHAGVIGRGARRYEAKEIPVDILTCDNELLMSALMACMDGNRGVVEGATTICLLLVELVSPDVMYNGLPWPDEDFTKQVSIERELYTCSTLLRCGAARSALRRAGGARPALCLASALLRAAAAAAAATASATAAATAAACNTDRSDSAESKRDKAVLEELLHWMTLGQLLPHPLSHLTELVPELNTTEMVQVLRDCIWNYTRDHVPSPALFTSNTSGIHWRDTAACKPPAQYTDTLRIIIQKRISKLGHLYPILFLDLEKKQREGERTY